MNDWQELAREWHQQPTAAAPDRAAIARMAARARLEGIAWRWKWWAVQACAAVIVVATVWIVLVTDRAMALKLLAIVFALLAAGAWWVARPTMHALLSIDALSAVDHLRAQRARAAAMPRFVAIDLAVYALCALVFAVLTLGWSQGADWLGIELAGRSATELLPLWGLLVVGVGIDGWRWWRSRRLLGRIDDLLAQVMEAPER